MSSVFKKKKKQVSQKKDADLLPGSVEGLWDRRKGVRVCVESADTGNSEAWFHAGDCWAFSRSRGLAIGTSNY